jgi:hypothetical protein
MASSVSKVERIAAARRQDHKKIAEQAKIVTVCAKLRAEGPRRAAARRDDPDWPLQIARSYDSRRADLARSEISRPVTLNFLFRVYARNANETRVADVPVYPAQNGSRGITIISAVGFIVIRSTVTGTSRISKKCIMTRRNWRSHI